MGTLYESAQYHPSEAENIAIGLYRDLPHAGLLYREHETSPAWFLHFCGHRSLKRSTPDLDCHIWIVPDILPEQETAVIANAILVFQKNQNRNMTYGFSDPRGFFDNDGNIVFAANHVGLTCATFLLAIFDLSGCALVQYGTWEPRNDDVPRQRQLIQFVVDRHPNEVGHIQRMGNEIGNLMYRPIEVGASALTTYPPIAFKAAINLSDQIRRYLAY